MKKGNLKRRILSLLTLVAILIPMFALTVYASSDKVDFGFTFNGAATAYRKSGVKTDIGEDSDGYAGVTITTGVYTTGCVKIWMEDVNGIDITDIRSGINTTGTFYLIYYSDAFSGKSNPQTVQFCCASTVNVQAVAGRFQP